MAKQQKTPFGIFTEAIGLYFSNFTKFFKYMTFPVLGQILGLILIFFTTYVYVINMPKLILRYPNLDNLNSLIIISILITLPGLAIFCKAFWEYLVAYGAINSMFENMISSGRVYDFDAHKELITRRSFSFIGLWMLVGVFSLLALCPLFTVICFVFAVYFILVFQVFTFEPDLTPIGCAKKSLMLVKGKFGSTFMLILFTGLLTYVFIPQTVLMGFDGTGILNGFSKALLPLINLLPDFSFPNYGLELKHTDIALSLVRLLIAQIFVQYTLPVRSIVCSLWYRELNGNLPMLEVAKNKRIAKRPSEKLMEASKKKFSKKKLDENIIKRAMEKDDDD